MGKLMLCCFLLYVVAVFAEQDYNIAVERGNDIDFVEVRNQNGELIELIEVHAEEEYQIMKPVDGNECFISRVDRSGKGEKICAEPEQWRPETLQESERSREKCGNRTVFMLRENTCDDLLTGRTKRACVTRVLQKTLCERTEIYCKRYGWWWGKNTCKEYGQRCVYEVVSETVQICDE